MIQWQKKKSGVKNVWKFVPLRGGGGCLMANTILNIHFDYLHPSLRATSRKLGLSCSKNSTQTGDELLHILNRYDTLIHHCAKNEIQSKNKLIAR